MSSVVHIGTSGWHYDDWIGPFYPADISPSDRLAFYATQFSTVEINNSFYRLPSVTSAKAWASTVPKDFHFAVKASRYTTHVKRLKDAPQSFAKFFPRIDPLKRKLGPVLFQLPPHFVPDVARLESFIAALPKHHRYVFEFRDPRWFTDDVFDALTRANCAFCIFDLAGVQSPNWLTADFAYIRLHGPGQKYQGSYSDAALRDWARVIRSCTRHGADVYCYFDNDIKAAAPKDALRLQAMLAGRSKR